MRRCWLLVFGILLLVSVMGCSTSIPLSETYIFTSEEGRQDSLKWKSSEALAYTSNNQAILIKEFIRKQHPDEAISDRDFWSLNKQGYGLLYSKNASRFSWGFNIGYRVMGVNATVDLGSNNYITGNVAVSGGAELILQRKLFHKTEGKLTGGMTLGLFGKRDYFGYEGGGMFAGPNLDFLHTYGGRTMIHFRHQKHAIHGFASYGYSPELGNGILNIGISFGGDLFR